MFYLLVVEMMSTYRRAWVSCGVVLAVVGAVGLTDMQVGDTVFLALAAGSLGAWANAAYRTHAKLPADWRQIVWGGARIGGCTVAGAGLVALLGGSGFLLILLYAACSPWCVGRVGAAVRTREGGDSHSTSPAERNPHPIESPEIPDFAGMSNGELCLAWRRSFIVLQKNRTGERMPIVGLRQACLDELQRRDPVGFARWLDAGARAASDPSRFLFANDSYHFSADAGGALPREGEQGE